MFNSRISVLDHGYIELVESWGSDARIVEAARMSTGKGFLGWGKVETCNQCDGSGTGQKALGHGPGSLCPQCRGRKVFINTPGDEKLLKYLYDNSHATPFEMGGLVIEVQAPIFVFREWHRHRTQSYNELSARYTPLPDTNYVPSVERIMMTSATNKQAQGTGTKLYETDAHVFRKKLEESYMQQQAVYENALHFGIPKELARLCLPVGRYSRMRASANLRNWLAFLTLRSDKNPNAQWEIRQYANALGHFVKEKFPRTWELFSP